MKHVTAFLLFTLCFYGQIQAQDEMIIEAGEPGIIEQTIFGDTTETGERMNPNRVYILRRGTPYLLAQNLRWGDYHIRLKAEEGEGARPILIFANSEGGGTLSSTHSHQFWCRPKSRWHPC